MGDLTERLLAVEGGNEGTHWYRNPDGPEAATRIAELEATLKNRDMAESDLLAKYANRECESARLEAERDAALQQVYVCGSWRCAKCSFVLQQMVIDAASGTIAAQDKPGEPCPNCASPLWRVTWRQEAEEMGKRAEEQMGRIAELEAEVARLREALRHYASDCDATETTPCPYEGNLCCRVARDALAAPDTGGAG